MDQIKVGLFIQECRKKQNMTQGDLARALHVSDQAVSKWERGLNYPDIGLLSDLADLLRVSVPEILHGELSMDELKTEDAVKEVLDFTSTVIKKENKLFTKKIMVLRLVIALIIAVLLSIYVQETNPRYVSVALTASDENYFANHYHGLEFIRSWDYCGNPADIQTATLHRSTWLKTDPDILGFQIQFPISTQANEIAKIFCPATLELNRNDRVSMLKPTASKDGTLLWSDADQYPDQKGMYVMARVVRNVYQPAFVHYWIYDVSNGKDPDTLQLYTRFSFVYKSFRTNEEAVTVNGTTAIITVKASALKNNKRVIPESYLSAIETGLTSFMIRVGDSVMATDVMDVNAYQFENIYRLKMGDYPFTESRSSGYDSGAETWVTRQTFTSADGTAIFSFNPLGQALTLDLLHNKATQNPAPILNTLSMLLSNDLEIWPVPATLYDKVKAVVSSQDPWIIEDGVTIICVEVWENYHITWPTLSPSE